MTINWSNLWAGFFYALCIIIVVGVTSYAFSDVTVTQYVLTTGRYENIGLQKTVQVIKNNSPDDSFILPDTMSYWNAARFVDSLNKTIK
jgi:hypothetical protein